MKKNRIILCAVLVLAFAAVSLFSLPLLGRYDPVEVCRVCVDSRVQAVEVTDQQAAAAALPAARRSLIPRAVGPQQWRDGDLEVSVLVYDGQRAESYHIFLSPHDKNDNYIYSAGGPGYAIRAHEGLYERITALLP